MKVHVKTIREDGYQWSIHLMQDGEIIFFFKVPYDRIDPLWHDWDESEEEMTVQVDLDIKLPIFKVIRQLVEVIVDIVKTRHLTFFYFTANTGKKASLYSKLINRYANLLVPGNWTVQNVGRAFYFTKK